MKLTKYPIITKIPFIEKMALWLTVFSLAIIFSCLTALPGRSKEATNINFIINNHIISFRDSKYQISEARENSRPYLILEANINTLSGRASIEYPPSSMTSRNKISILFTTTEADTGSRIRQIPGYQKFVFAGSEPFIVVNSGYMQFEWILGNPLLQRNPSGEEIGMRCQQHSNIFPNAILDCRISYSLSEGIALRYQFPKEFLPVWAEVDRAARIFISQICGTCL